LSSALAPCQEITDGIDRHTIRCRGIEALPTRRRRERDTRQLAAAITGCSPSGCRSLSHYIGRPNGQKPDSRLTLNASHASRA